MPEQPRLFAPPPDAPRLASVPLPPGISATARWSEDRRYRYSLIWQPIPPREGRKPAVIGLNPSGASETCGDRTLCRVYSLLGGGFTMLNLFGLRATDPAELGRSADPVGPDNDETILEAVRTASFVVVAWGAPPSGRVGDLVRDRALVVRAALRGKTVLCWGTTKDGSPRHPLYLPGTAELIPWGGR